MSEKKQRCHEAYNFKELYKKQYGDIAKLTTANRYTPEQIFNLAVKYFEWAELNAIKSAESASFQGKTYQDEVTKPRIFTMSGLRLFCSFSKCAVDKWRKEPGFAEVMEFIDSVIFEQKFQLAANGIVNAGFIGKELGIEQASTINVSANAEAASDVNNVTAEEVRDAVKDIMELI